jgi:hypothetical protein
MYCIEDADCCRSLGAKSVYESMAYVWKMICTFLILLGWVFYFRFVDDGVMLHCCIALLRDWNRRPLPLVHYPSDAVK